MLMDLRVTSPLTGERIEHSDPEDIEYYSDLVDYMKNMRARTRMDMTHQDIACLTEDERKIFGGYVEQRTLDGAWRRGNR